MGKKERNKEKEKQRESKHHDLTLSTLEITKMCWATRSTSPTQALSRSCVTGEKLGRKTETFVLSFALNLHVLNISIFVCSMSVFLLLYMHTCVGGTGTSVKPLFSSKLFKSLSVKILSKQVFLQSLGRYSESLVISFLLAG